MRFTFNTIFHLEAFLGGGGITESGGLLLGNGTSMVTSAVPIPNIADDPEHEYRPDPQLMAERLRATEIGGFKLMGTYHSHPNGEPVMSRADTALLEAADLLLLVAAPHRGEPEWAWGLWAREGEIPLEIAPPRVDF